jgi:hypothetical protein
MYKCATNTHTTTATVCTTTTIIIIMNSEAFYNIIDNERSINDMELISVTVEGSIMTAQSRTAYMRRLIPMDGFEMVELTQITEMLNVDRYELASRLVTTTNQGGITFDLIGELMHLYNFVVLIQGSPIDNNIRRFEFVPVPAPATAVALPVVVSAAAPPPRPTVVHPRLIPVAAHDNDDDNDEICAICIETKGQHEQWVTAAGCNAHRFHASCISQWTRGTCPTCRANLQGSCC